MPTNYEALHSERDLENELVRATGLLADMYGDPSHFILELLQNAEDALGKRDAGWCGSRAVCFSVLENSVEVAHYGRPFDEADVRGIAITLNSTKEDDLNSIGKFGIGFKSVFNITDRPEIHSGDEHFAIANRIRPTAVEAIPGSDPDQTIFRLPLNVQGLSHKCEIVKKLAALEPRTLLFLSHIDGIVWQSVDGQKGKLSRQTEILNQTVRNATITRENAYGQITSEIERWVVFSRAVDDGGKPAGYVEIAFQLSERESDGLQPVSDSLLTVFFPTEVRTRLGFLMHGPYRTTPNRENVPLADDWNKNLVMATADLIPHALRWLKENKMLDAKALNAFPIRENSAEDQRYEPLYQTTKVTLTSQALLPCSDGSYHTANKVRLGSTDAIRQLFDPQQLAKLYGEAGRLFWVSGEITEDRFRELRQYIRDELQVADVTPVSLVPLLRNGLSFLEAQPDEWICRLYGFFAAQPALHDNLKDIPLLRLEDGQHIAMEGETQVFLPGKATTLAHTIRSTVCNTDAALRFLKELGLRERDPIDDVIENVLPKYGTPSPDDANYDNDMRLIVNAYKEFSTERKGEFIEALKDVPFVIAEDARDGSRRFVTAQEVYLADDDRRKLFTGVNGILFTAGGYNALNSPDAHEMLENCGATPSDDMTSIVVQHVLPKYQGARISVNAIDYARDIKRILTAYENIRNEHRFTLLNPLRRASWVQAIDAGSGAKRLSGPESLYLGTKQLQDLFSGVENVWIVDDGFSCLRSERVIALLEACSASPRLARTTVEHTYSPAELRDVRRNAGLEASTRVDPIRDWTLRGVAELLDLLPQLPIDVQLCKSALLWQSLADLAKHSRYDEFQTTYRWSYSHETKTAHLDTEIIKQLNNVAWIPDADGRLRLPSLVYFGTVREVYNWESEPILEAKIRFKAPEISELSRLSGIDEDALGLMKQYNLTAEDIRKWIPEEAPDPVLTPERETRTIPGPRPTPDPVPTTVPPSTSDASHTPTRPSDPRQVIPGSGTRNFISYIATHPDGTESDPDPGGLEHEQRMSLEAKAINFILDREPEWKRAPANNPGYDLYQADQRGTITAWCEVKAMSGTLDNRPASMTKRQFEEAGCLGDAYWLYVVENAATDNPRLVKIQNPAGLASTFTFDKGWREIAEIVQ